MATLFSVLGCNCWFRSSASMTGARVLPRNNHNMTARASQTDCARASSSGPCQRDARIQDNACLKTQSWTASTSETKMQCRTLKAVAAVRNPNKSNEAIVHVLAMCRDCLIKSHLTSCRSVRAAISSGFRWIVHAVNRSLCSKGIIITGLSFGKGKPD